MARLFYEKGFRMREENLRSRWYGKINNVEILTGSSGSFQIKLNSNLLSKSDFDELLNDILLFIRAPESVEDD